MPIGLIVLLAVAAAIALAAVLICRAVKREEQERERQAQARTDEYKRRRDELDQLFNRLTGGELEVLKQLDPYRDLFQSYIHYRSRTVAKIALEPQRYFDEADAWKAAMRGTDVGNILGTYRRLVEKVGLTATDALLTSHFGKKTALRRRTQDRINRLHSGLVKKAELAEDKYPAIAAILEFRSCYDWQMGDLYDTERIKRPSLPGWWNDEVAAAFETPCLRDFDWSGVQMAPGEWTAWAARSIENRSLTDAKMILAKANDAPSIRQQIGEVLYAALALVAHAPETSASLLKDAFAKL